VQFVLLFSGLFIPKSGYDIDIVRLIGSRDKVDASIDVKLEHSASNNAPIRFGCIRTIKINFQKQYTHLKIITMKKYAQNEGEMM